MPGKTNPTDATHQANRAHGFRANTFPSRGQSTFNKGIKRQARDRSFDTEHLVADYLALCRDPLSDLQRWIDESEKGFKGRSLFRQSPWRSAHAQSSPSRLASPGKGFRDDALHAMRGGLFSRPGAGLSQYDQLRSFRAEGRAGDEARDQKINAVHAEPLRSLRVEPGFQDAERGDGEALHSGRRAASGGADLLRPVYSEAPGEPPEEALASDSQQGKIAEIRSHYASLIATIQSAFKGITATAMIQRLQEEEAAIVREIRERRHRANRIRHDEPSPPEEIAEVFPTELQPG